MQKIANNISILCYSDTQEKGMADIPLKMINDLFKQQNADELYIETGNFQNGEEIQTVFFYL